MKTRILLLAFCIGLAPAAARADVKPHALCSEGMVLQQKSNVNIWGTADNGEKVTVSFRGKTSTATADANGNWIVAVASGEAGGPFELTIKGNNTIAYKNVLVGEVWICSGQSNMAQTVNGSDKGDKQTATTAKHNPMLRMFTVARSPQNKPQANTTGAWLEAKPETVGGFSAVGYFFGRNLNENRKVPVGLIHTSWGGTRIEAWTSQSALKATGLPISPAKGPNVASALYNGMIHPLLNYQVQGAIWYQGESNAGQAYKYRTLHPAMIENWRADFKNPNLAFYFVQLAPFNTVAKQPGESNWAELREAQTMTLAKLKNTGMAVITDCGDELDIHPVPKRPIGIRLALAARAQTYGEKIVYSGPMYKSAKFGRGQATLSFDHIGGGLVGMEIVPTPSARKGAKNAFAWRVKEGSSTSAPLVGFTVCGKDRVFHNAKAEISGETVIVSCDKVDAPIAVRYGWANHPICNLYNREGLPASPFRTDTFRGITQPKQ
ncbi:MAG: sialate O-acetylesterase [Planctomycetes bacterium]|nr:sialate O-acetylesterase [Planctomycetota bacterium]